jgi:hypothetical protein
MAVGNLEFIKSATGSSVSSLEVTDCFNSKYDVYAVTISKIDVSTTGSARFRFLDSGGTEISASEYDTAGLRMRTSAAYEELRYTNQTYIQYSFSTNDNSAYAGGQIMYVFNPYDSSSYTFVQYQQSSYATDTYLGFKSIGVHKSAETISGLKYYFAGGSFDNLTINVYGVK